MELLVTIAIIAIIGSASILSYNAVMNNTRDEEYEKYIENIESAACTYASVKNLRDTCSDTICELTLNKNDLLLEGYLKEKDILVVKEEKLPNELIKVTWNSDGEKNCLYEEADK